MINALTVDVEDYFHVQAFAGVIEPKRWDEYPCRVERNTDRVLDLCARYDVQATFFVLGWVARRFPQLVARIRQAGHWSAVMATLTKSFMPAVQLNFEKTSGAEKKRLKMLWEHWCEVTGRRATQLPELHFGRWKF